MKRDLLELFNELGLIIGTGRRHWFLIDASATGLGATVWLFTQRYFWHSPEALLLIILLTAADFATGVWISIRRKNTETRRAKRGLYTIVALAGVLFFAHQFAKHEPDMFGWLPTAVYFPMVVIQLSSLVKNLSLLGYIPTKIANALWERLDAYKNPEPPTNSKQNGI